MPPENPYAAPQTVDQPIAALFERQHALAENIDLVHSGARLGLKAVWVSLFHLALVLAVTFVAPQLRELRPWMSWTLVGAAAYCFLLGLVAFWQLPPQSTFAGCRPRRS